MQTHDAMAWDSEPEIWELAARGETAAASILASFLVFWSAVSAQTLGAMLMWAHSGSGLSERHQRPPVDATAVQLLSIEVLHQVRALLVQGDTRPLPELAIDAHLSATERLLGSFPYYDEEIPAPKYCADCLWQHLARLARASAGMGALQWFASVKRQFTCTVHLRALNEILGRLKASTPQIRDVEWELSSLEVKQTLQKYAPFVIPVTVRLLLPAIMVTGFVGAALLSPAPAPGTVLRTQALLQRRSDEPIELSVAKEPPPPEPAVTPASNTPPTPSPRVEFSKPTSSKRQTGQTGGGTGSETESSLPPGTSISPIVAILDPNPDGPGDFPSTPVPRRLENLGGTDTSSSADNDAPGAPGTSPATGTSGGGAEGSRAVFDVLAQRLSARLQGRGKSCTVGGHVFAVVPGRGLLMDGMEPRLEDMALMRLALKECRR